MPDGGAPSQAMSQPDFSPYLPLSGQVSGTSFLIDMNVVFERFLYVALGEALGLGEDR